MNTPVRVRFAPSPTGSMHLGNVRTALINYLFARHYKGTFIIRIEDTDQQRLFDPEAQGILRDLAWLELTYDEGPHKGGPCGPYYQSQRHSFYQDYLNRCIAQEKVYRCFCTAQELERKRERQIAQKLPPRYDRTCLRLSPEEIQEKEVAGVPFILRFKLPAENVTITDLARGSITYDLRHFSDFAVTRQDGSCTFIFANFVDDVLMQISHVIRGEDHLSNTASQAALYHGLGQPMPLFWHLPIMANTDGKKLSKRDFGFSLADLKNAGYLPEAITNYLALLGGSTKQPASEIMSLSELAEILDFDHITTTGQIKYDIEKLRWVNQKWIQKIPYIEFKQRIAELVTLPDAPSTDTLLQLIKPELVTLHDIQEKIAFYFTAPQLSSEALTDQEKNLMPFLQAALAHHHEKLSQPDLFMQALMHDAREQQIPSKPLYTLLRVLLTGHTHGLGIKDILMLLGAPESYKRLSEGLKS